MNVSWTALGLLALSLAQTSGEEFKIQIEAPRRDMKAVVLAVPAPKEFPVSGMLKADRFQVPFQKRASGEVVFVLPELKQGQRTTLAVTPEPLKSAVTVDPAQGKIPVSLDGKPVLIYQGMETELPRPDIKPIYKRGAYLHPVYTPGGKVLTDDYPPNHLHHHGIWFPWTKTVFEGHEVDFWNMGEGKGKVELVTFKESASGPVEGSFAVEQRFVDLTGEKPKPALNETWQVTTYRVPGADYFLFDLVSTQRCATNEPLKLPKYYYGGLGFRGNWSWNGEDKCYFLTSNGETNRVKGNETRANWCFIGGEVDGGFAGITIFCHPDNFRAPQPMRLHPKEPFFCYAPSQPGDWTIEPGQNYVSRYRFAVKDGPPNRTELDSIWAAWSEPPKVEIIAEGAK